MQRPCLDCGTPASASRCPTCAGNRATRISRERESNRPSREARGYDYTWRQIRLAILDRDGWACYRCGKQLVDADATVDHLLPKAKGGTDHPSNLAACCRAHNSGKRDRVR